MNIHALFIAYFFAITFALFLVVVVIGVNKLRIKDGKIHIGWEYAIFATLYLYSIWETFIQ